jgi:hypothetical protein
MSSLKDLCIFSIRNSRRSSGFHYQKDNETTAFLNHPKKKKRKKKEEREKLPYKLSKPVRASLAVPVNRPKPKNNR